MTPNEFRKIVRNGQSKDVRFTDHYREEIIELHDYEVTIYGFGMLETEVCIYLNNCLIGCYEFNKDTKKREWVTEIPDIHIMKLRLMSKH